MHQLMNIQYLLRLYFLQYDISEGKTHTIPALQEHTP